MAKGILGKKLGMTQIFNDEGKVIPVTVVEAGPCVVLQKKTKATDGYEAIQIGFDEKEERKTNKPEKGHFDKAGVKPQRYIKEIRLDEDGTATYEVGQEIKADVFAQGEYVDVSGISKGKGFAGAIKRHGFHRGPMGHGSHYHRAPGSLGPVDPARVFKNRQLPGHMGQDNVTVQKLEIIKVDIERNLLLVKGALPGARDSYLVIKDSVKA